MNEADAKQLTFHAWRHFYTTYMADKVLNLRIFDDDDGVMNKSLIDVEGSILSISQFTLYGDTKKGRRPSYINALGHGCCEDYF